MSSDFDVIRQRARQRMRPQTGIEQAQGLPYRTLPPQVRRTLETPNEGSINIRGWVNPYKLTFYGYPAPDGSSGASAVQVLAANWRRCYLIIQNKGPGNLFVNFGSEPSTTGSNCLQLVSTQVYEQIGGGGVFPDKDSTLVSSFVARDAVYILSDLAGTTVAVGEGTWSDTIPPGMLARG